MTNGLSYFLYAILGGNIGKQMEVLSVRIIAIIGRDVAGVPRDFAVPCR